MLIRGYLGLSLSQSRAVFKWETKTNQLGGTLSGGTLSGGVIQGGKKSHTHLAPCPCPCPCFGEVHHSSSTFHHPPSTPSSSTFSSSCTTSTSDPSTELYLISDLIPFTYSTAATLDPRTSHPNHCLPVRLILEPLGPSPVGG